MGKEQETALIIGAGPAGLTTAYQLLKYTDILPVIFEASNDIGGISKTINYNGNRIDIGGHRFYSKNKTINDIWLELMPLQTFPSSDDIKLNKKKNFNNNNNLNPETDENVMLLRDRVSRIFYNKHFINYPISLSLSTFFSLGLLKTIDILFGFLIACIRKRKEKNLEDFYINRFGIPLYKTFFESYTEKVWGIHPSNISKEWGIQRIKGLSILKILSEILKKIFVKNFKTKETSLIEEFYYPKKGPGQYWEKMAEYILNNGGKIHLLSEVIGIETENNNIKSIKIKKQNGNTEKYSGNYIISSMPVKDFVNALDNVPDTVKQTANGLPYRDFISVGILLDKLIIKNNTQSKKYTNLPPDCWIYIQDSNVRMSRLQIFNNWSPYMVKDSKKVWLGIEYCCNENDELWNKTEDEIIDFAANELIQTGIAKNEDVQDATVIKIKKAYPAYFGTYKNIDVVNEFLDNINNLYCIGRNGQHKYNNMDHSMLTGICAVDLITKREKDKSKLRDINTEQVYGE